MSQFPQYNQGGPGYNQGPGLYNSSAPDSGATPQDFFKNVNVSPEVLNFGLSAGQDIINRQRARWMPGVSDFWHSLKIYFAVSNKYVVKKLGVILYPMGNTVWQRISADEVGAGGGVHEATGASSSYSTHKWALPKQDANAPDLYIPLMSFITYVLLIGLNKGLVSGFTPEVLVQAVWRSLLLQTVETLAIKLGLSTMQVPLPFLDVFAYTGYKYVGLCLTVVSKLFGWALKLIVGSYVSVALAYFVLKSMAAVVPPTVSTGPPRHLMLLGFAGIQGLVAFVLCVLW